MIAGGHGWCRNAADSERRVTPQHEAALQGAHCAEAVRAGEPGRVAMAFSMQIFAFYFMGRQSKVAERLREARTLANQAGAKDVQALIGYTEAISSAAGSPLPTTSAMHTPRCPAGSSMKS